MNFYMYFVRSFIDELINGVGSSFGFVVQAKTEPLVCIKLCPLGSHFVAGSRW